MSLLIPQSVFPSAIDNDFTLFKVYNTAETILTVDNQAWSQEISIKSRLSTECEIWADNGFANLDGELLYYGSVDKTNGRVSKFKRCLRNIGGTHTHFNKAGTWIRGFVIAEHHIQIVNAIMKVQNFVGENFTEDEATLDWRIRNLFAEPIIFDDSSCPDVTLNFNIISNDPNQGVVANYFVQTTGQVGSIEVQFGDGQSSTQPSGTHTYAVNANIDPIVVVTNDDCEIVQSPLTRTEATQPKVRVPVPPFFVPVPILPDFPPINFPSIPIPSVDLFFPPIIFPSLTFGLIPSSITFVPPNPLPSVINFGPLPTFTPIPFGPPPTFSPVPFGSSNVPSKITLTPAVPSRIELVGPNPPLPKEISIKVPSNLLDGLTIKPVSWTTPPRISVDWGKPPVISISCVCRVACPSTSTVNAMAMTPFGMTEDLGEDIEIEYDTVGFPSEIKVVAPYIEPIQVVHELPKSIALVMPEWKDIKIVGHEQIPSEIKFTIDTEALRQVISLQAPEFIKLDTTGASVKLEFPSEMPKIKLDTPESIRVVGIPDVISVAGIPSFIDLRGPEKIPLVFEGPPLSAEVKITLDVQKLIGDPDNPLQCVAIVPCGNPGK